MRLTLAIGVCMVIAMGCREDQNKKSPPSPTPPAPTMPIDAPSVDASASGSASRKLNVTLASTPSPIPPAAPTLLDSQISLANIPGTISPKTVCGGTDTVITLTARAGSEFPEQRTSSSFGTLVHGVFIGVEQVEAVSWTKTKIEVKPPRHSLGGPVYIRLITNAVTTATAPLVHSGCRREQGMFTTAPTAPPRPAVRPGGRPRLVPRPPLPRPTFSSQVRNGRLIVKGGSAFSWLKEIPIPDIREELTLATQQNLKFVPRNPGCFDVKLPCESDGGNGCKNEITVLEAPRIKQFHATGGWPSLSWSPYRPNPFKQMVPRGDVEIAWTVDGTPDTTVQLQGVGVAASGTDTKTVTGPIDLVLSASNACTGATPVTSTLKLTTESTLSVSTEELSITAGQQATISFALSSPAPAGGVTLTLTGAPSELTLAPNPIVFAEGETAKDVQLTLAAGTPSPGTNIAIATLQPTLSDATIFPDFVSIRVLVTTEPTPTPPRGNLVHACFEFHDGGGTRPMANMWTEIHSFKPRLAGVWTWGVERGTGPEGLKTDANGCINEDIVDGQPEHIYSIRILATTDTASVVISDGMMLPFFIDRPERRPVAKHVEFGTSTFNVPGNPNPALELTIARYFNVARKLDVARQVAQSLRASTQTDQIKQIMVKPHGAAEELNYSYLGVIWLHPTRMLQDFTVVHEYGHILEDQLGYFPAIAASHDGCEAFSISTGDIIAIITGLGIFSMTSHLVNSPEFAWQEGFATWFGDAAVNLRPADFNRPNTPPPNPATLTGLGCRAVGQRDHNGRQITEEDVEDFVTDALHSLMFCPPGPGCAAFLTQRAQMIFQIMDDELKRGANIDRFRAAWIARGLPQAEINTVFTNLNFSP